MSSNHQLKPMPTEHNAKALGSYLTGFIISVILIYAIFYIAHHQVFKGVELMLAIGVFAVLEFITMVVCFLRINGRTSEGRWDLLVLIFTILIIAIVITGSLWIMYNLNYYMVN